VRHRAGIWQHRLDKLVPFGGNLGEQRRGVRLAQRPERLGIQVARSVFDLIELLNQGDHQRRLVNR
jgi:hypothetical protein